MIIHPDTFLKATAEAKSQKFFIGLSKSCWVVSKKLQLSPSKIMLKIVTVLEIIYPYPILF